MFEFTIVIHNILVYLQLVHHLLEVQEAQEAPLISEDEKNIYVFCLIHNM